jgi:diguanylate cyclase (GGDEF)-like protein
VADCLAVLPLPEALAALERGAGAQFDPEIVALVLRNRGEIERAFPPASGEPGAPVSEAWLEPVASAARRDRLLRGLLGDLGQSLVLAETLGEFDGRLRELIGYRSMAVWTPRENRLVAAYISGADARWLCSLEIQFGRGVSGRVADTGRAVWNGNPAEEGEYTGQGTGPQSVTAVPLEHGGELAAVLALYHGQAGAFQEDDLEILLHIRAKLAAAVAHASQYESLEKMATEDAATRLPNERALFLRLDAELARCRRTRGRLAVLVCDVEAHRLRRRPGALQAVATGLRRLCREEDCVARMGDRFVLVLSSFAEHHLAEKRRRMEAMMADIGPAMDGERPAVQVAAAFFPDDGAYAEDLLAVAEARMTAAAPAGAGEANPA